MHSKLFNYIFVLLFVSTFVFMNSCGPSVRNEKPKLVIMITLDQFRAGYLETYDSVFKGGFRRFNDEGWRYDKALVDHAPTLSWPGHTTIATGVHPKNHGILSNDFIQEKTRRQLYLLDTESQILGHPRGLNFSARSIKATGIADWIHAADTAAVTVSLSTGPGLAVCYGGQPQPERSKNHVYWFDRAAGGFITSTFYRDEYPEWLLNFNENILPQYKESTTWELAVPEEYRHLARKDEAAYEKEVGGGTTFPHKLDENARTDQRAINSWFYNFSPHANEALLNLAKESVKALQLGQRNSTDLLTIAIKSTDRVGHDFGPRSLEQLDNLYRLDLELGEFFVFLDQTIGKDNYVVSLQADHGAPNIAEYEIEQGRPAKRVTEEELSNLLSNIEKFIEEYSGPEEELPSLIASELEKSDFIAKAMTAKDLAGTGPADRILQSYRNSYLPGHTTTFPLWTNKILYSTVSPKHPGNYGIIVEFIENAQIYTAPSAHVSSFAYDQEVPILFMGNGIKPGVAKEQAKTIDIAPTLAAIAGVPFPGSVDGKVLKVR